MWNIIRLGMFCTLFIALISLLCIMAHGNIFDTWSVRMENLMSPNPDTLVNVLERGLTKDFVHVNVRWVDCPDLTQEPFNLAAPGLCGQPAFIEIGDILLLQSNTVVRQIFSIKEIIQFLNRKRRFSFIFGNGVTCKYDQLILNSLFSQTTNGLMEIANRSRIVSFEFEEMKCNLKIIRDNELNCSRLGTFFLTEGLRGSVIEVRAKKYRSNDYLPGFIDSMRAELIHEFGSMNPVVLGGVYVVDNALWKHELVRHPWELGARNSSIRRAYCPINVPETIISTFNSSPTGYLLNSGFPPIKLTFQSTQSLSHHNGIGSSLFNKSKEDGIEYIGYFRPAEIVYRFDDPRIEFPNVRYFV